MLAAEVATSAAEPSGVTGARCGAERRGLAARERPVPRLATDFGSAETGATASAVSVGVADAGTGVPGSFSGTAGTALGGSGGNWAAVFRVARDAVARGERLPDYGPHVLGPAGATAVGARKPLVAFNLYFEGADEAVAKEIARTVRESSGGLPAVRAIGFFVPDRRCVTVSMNLVDHDVTGIRVAYDAVVAEAASRGLQVLDSEIVGLVPEAALGPGDVEHVRLRRFDPERQVLERLAEEAA
jgi:hypothetical protein